MATYIDGNQPGTVVDGVLNGTAGSDIIQGSDGNLTIYGFGGNDKIYSGYGLIESGQRIYGGDGNDEIVAEGGLSGAALYGDAGDDVLRGDAFHVTLDGGTGADLMIGKGSFILAYFDNIGDRLFIQQVYDVVSVRSSISIDLAKVIFGTGSAMVNLTLSGTVHASLTGNDFANELYGNDGNNLLVGLGGNDRLDGGAGVDTLNGGTGNDTYILGDQLDTVIDSSGIDTITSSITRSLVDYSFIENLTLFGTANANVTGNGLANILTGNSGVNVLNGGAGIDTLRGGDGNDLYLLGADNDKVEDTGGIDTISSTINRSLVNYTGIERLSLAGAGNYTATGNGLDNILTGNSGNNTLSAGAGGDILRGGLGNDTLTGGTGKDTFFFDTAPNSTNNFDRITDYSVADDTIQLENTYFSRFKVGAVSSANFVNDTTGVAHDSNDYLIYERDTGNMYYDVNGSAAGGSILFAKLGLNLAVTYEDFIIV